MKDRNTSRELSKSLSLFDFLLSPVTAARERPTGPAPTPQSSRVDSLPGGGRSCVPAHL